MYCVKCGYKISDTAKICTHCGTMVSQNNQNLQPVNNNKTTTDVDTKVNKEENKKATPLCVMSLICGYVIPLVFSNSKIPPLLLNCISLASLVLVIIARIKYPNSELAKVLLFIYVAEILLGAIIFIIFFEACSAICGPLGDMG